MPLTAQRYGLTVTEQSNERLDPAKATRAAARYLRDLHDRFGSWPLALAAYNAGEQAVEKAISRAGSKDFAVLSSLRLLPAETRRYVPAVLAAASLFGPAGLAKPQQRFTRVGEVIYAGPIGKGSGTP